MYDSLQEIVAEQRTLMRNKKKIVKFFLIAVPLIAIWGLLWMIFNPKDFYAIQSNSRDFIAKFGAFGPAIFVLMQAGQVIVTPISHYSMGALGGFLYGTYLGTILNYVGRIIGHIAAFAIARRFGRKIVERFVDEETMRKYDYYVSGEEAPTRQLLILFLIYGLPFFPDDEVSYLIGLSKMKFKYFLIANIFGHVTGSLHLAYLGSGINVKDFLFWGPFVISFFGFILIYFLLRSKRKSYTTVQE